MRIQGIQAQIDAWAELIEDILDNREIDLSDSMELYLELDHSTAKCLYYFVDHSTHTLFWLQELSTDHLWMKPVVSESHLRRCVEFYFGGRINRCCSGMALEEQYWTHIEAFCSHSFNYISISREQLIDIFMQGQLGS